MTLALTDDERRTLDGEYGIVPRKILATVCRLAEVMEADRLCDIDGMGHLVIQDARPGFGARMEFLEEIAAAGVRSKFPMTIDPRRPMDRGLFSIAAEDAGDFDAARVNEARYQELLLKIGLRKDPSYTCTPWFEEVGNKPSYGQVVAWAESSAVIYANSVLGARTHRNAGVIELICNLAGKTPYAGLITDRGRRSNWTVILDVNRRPDPQALGYMIGKKVLDGVPYIVGLRNFFPPRPSRSTLSYLHSLGTNLAVGGAVGLFHIEGVTPEAAKNAGYVLPTCAETLEINDHDIDEALEEMHAESGYGTPEMCLIGCPHLSLAELEGWVLRITQELGRVGRSRLQIGCILVAAPGVVREFEARSHSVDILKEMGVSLTALCLEALKMDPLCAWGTVATNSNKLRYYNRGVIMMDDDQLLQTMVYGFNAVARSD